MRTAVQRKKGVRSTELEARQETWMPARGHVLLRAGATFLVIKSGLTILAGDNRGASHPDCLLKHNLGDEREEFLLYIFIQFTVGHVVKGFFLHLCVFV